MTKVNKKSDLCNEDNKLVFCDCEAKKNETQLLLYLVQRTEELLDHGFNYKAVEVILFKDSFFTQSIIDINALNRCKIVLRNQYSFKIVS